jgi:hypothetical protein
MSVDIIINIHHSLLLLFVCVVAVVCRLLVAMSLMVMWSLLLMLKKERGRGVTLFTWINVDIDNNMGCHCLGDMAHLLACHI